MAARQADAATAATDFSQFAGLRAAAQRHDPAALRKAAQQFEALMTETLLKTSRQTQFGDDMTGEQGDFYKDMFDQQMAMHLSAGKGLGLADMLVRQLGGLQAGVAQSAAAGATSVKAYAQVQSASGTDATAATSAATGGWQPKSAQDFVDAVRPHAEKAAAELGIPARALVAQAALETGWGQHLPQQDGDGTGLNLFGVKAGSSWSGATTSRDTAEYQSGQWSTEKANFRSYGSIGAAFDDYVQFLKTNPRYASALRSGNVQGFAQGLQQAGYATDPQYAQKLMRVAYSARMSDAYGAST
jgi:flagellar protein FlgJ